jgi:hypothetical protein
MSKRTRVLLLAAGVAVFCFGIGGKFGAPANYGVVPNAEARVGRPLTPVSVAGVARRTARRCAVGVYSC